jgi:hypothetical protein
MIEKKKMKEQRMEFLFDYVEKCSLDELKPLLDERINAEILMPLPDEFFPNRHSTIFVYKGKTPCVQGEFIDERDFKYPKALGYMVKADNDLTVPEVVATVFNEMVEKINETNRQRTWGYLLTACEAPDAITVFFEQVKDKIAPRDALYWLYRVKRYMVYPEVNLGDVDNWFLEMMPKILDNFKRETHGSLDQGWGDILDRMVYCFTEAGKNMYPPEHNYRYRNKMKNEGFDLLKKHFWDLWD